ncbi:twin-arginine translocation signal domain-containing protein [Halomonas alkalisoli]|uniref:twin-arginine translocation signal domain-containing protein n=1 Tax=Halomonas alkalisoli TaxID=2907158 RepID=UPI001F3EC1C0|nr:twin-arginine translocation signal domain-containing protein [Halomonas alkalisoli]MCE9681337.1 twin-arginine translocation signal domain-containing protein [Halomonas alkalisoli]
MSTPPISRRVFLKGSGGVLAGTLVFTSGPIALLAPSRSWAMSLDTLSTRQGEVMLAVTRHIFPHAELEDAVYAMVVKSLDRKAADVVLHQVLHDGVVALDDAADGDWLSLDETAQLELLTSMEGTPFFATVRGDAVVSLYDNPLAYAHFGYEGAEGDSGYLSKGFNDLTWLPDPPKPQGGYLPFEEPAV